MGLGNFKHGEKVGFWIGYYENGQLHWQKEYVFFGYSLDYTKKGSYYENGEIKEKGKYLADGGILYKKSWDEKGDVIYHLENYGWEGNDHRY